MKITTLIAVDHDQVKLLQQALALSRDMITDIASECHEDPAQALREVETMQGKLNEAFAVIDMRRQVAHMEQQLQEPAP